MPTIPVNHNGAVLYYEDSGAPAGAADYSTIFILHGFIYHGACFRPLFHFAAAKNLRLVTVNMREYPGSSPLNEREMANVWSQEPEKQAAALRDQAIELATFMARFIEAENVPAPKRIGDKEVGGVSLVTWSQGNGHMLSLLSNISNLDARINSLLGQYMRTVFMYDPPSQVLGIPYPPGLTTPVENPEYSNEQKAGKFIEWIATYWNPLQTPESITVSALVNRYDMYETSKDDKYLALTSRLSESELDSLVAPYILPRIGVAMMFAPEVYARALNQAVFDTKGQWENLKMVGLWPDMTIWCCSLSGRVMADMLAEPLSEGKVRRKVEMVRMNGTNHVYHYEEPEKFVQLLASYV